jgi:hypothetical protein
VYSNHGANGSSVYMVPYLLTLQMGNVGHIKARGTGEKADCFSQLIYSRLNELFEIHESQDSQTNASINRQSLNIITMSSSMEAMAYLHPCSCLWATCTLDCLGKQ